MTTNTATWGAEQPLTTGFFTALATAFDRARAKHKTARALSELDDHVLLDIGLNPAEFRRDPRSIADWVVQSHSGTARIVFIGR